jgi:nucleoside phosphorylase
MLLITPTHSEYTAVRAALDDRLAQGRLGLTQCGMGMAAAAALCRRLERSGWTGAMALLGWAGGLSPDLAAGDCVVANAALDTQGHCVPLPAPDVPGATVGSMLCVPAPLATPQAKRYALRSGGTGAVAVEMEAYPLAVWAAARAVPFIHARVILDTVDEALPDLGDALDAQGRVRPLRLIARLVARPRTVVSLLWLARRVRELDQALGTLARAVVALAPE